jgi:hypothetical protein
MSWPSEWAIRFTCSQVIGTQRLSTAERYKIKMENVVGIELAFEFCLENLIDRHVFTFDSDQPW